MTTRILSATALLVAALTLAPLASALGTDSLEQRAGSMMKSRTSDPTPGGAGSLLGRMSTGSLNLGSMQNAAGALGYCQKQGYTKGASEQVKDKLTAKLGGQSQAERSDDYQQGMSGVLQGGQGQTFSLANLKDEIGERVCSAVARRAMSSFLGE